jgi:hypothetical protein
MSLLANVLLFQIFTRTSLIKICKGRVWIISIDRLLYGLNCYSEAFGIYSYVVGIRQEQEQEPTNRVQ